MKRFRLSTLLILIVVAALSLGLLEQGRRAGRREAELRLRIAEKDREIAEMRVFMRLNEKFSALGR
jgi:hypothetical protein